MIVRVVEWVQWGFDRFGKGICWGLVAEKKMRVEAF